MVLMRLATSDDAIALAELRWDHECEHHPNVAQSFSKDQFVCDCSAVLAEGIADGSWVCWLAIEDGLVIANIFVRRIRKVPKPQKLSAEIGYVTNVHTRMGYRNTGVGTELLRQVATWARGTRIECLFLWPSERSRPFYQRQGFTPENDVMELALTDLN